MLEEHENVLCFRLEKTVCVSLVVRGVINKSVGIHNSVNYQNNGIDIINVSRNNRGDEKGKSLINRSPLFSICNNWKLISDFLPRSVFVWFTTQIPRGNRGDNMKGKRERARFFSFHSKVYFNKSLLFFFIQSLINLLVHFLLPFS